MASIWARIPARTSVPWQRFQSHFQDYQVPLQILATNDLVKKRLDFYKTYTWIIHTWTYFPPNKTNKFLSTPPKQKNKTPCLSTRAFILLPHLGLRSNQLKICENFPVNNWVADCHNCIFLAILQIKILVTLQTCTPLKINGWNLKISQLKRNIIFQTLIFGFQLNFPGCT